MGKWFPLKYFRGWSVSIGQTRALFRYWQNYFTVDIWNDLQPIMYFKKSLIDSQACKIRLFPLEFSRISKQIHKTSCNLFFSLYLFSQCDDEAEVVSKSPGSELPHSPGSGVAPIYPMPPCPSNSISLHLNTSVVEQDSWWKGLCTSSGTWFLKWMKVSHNTLLSLSCNFCAHTYVFYITVDICIWRDTVFYILEDFPWLCCSAREYFGWRGWLCTRKVCCSCTPQDPPVWYERDHSGQLLLDTFLPLEMSFSAH